MSTEALPSEIVLFYGCGACGKTTQVSDVPTSQLVFPKGLELGCRFCGEFNGRITFTGADLAAALVPGPTAADPAERYLFWQCVPDMSKHHAGA